MSTPPSVPVAGGSARRETWLALLWIALLPLFLVGPCLLPGQRFLPLAPVALEPLASERPAEAERAWRGVDFLASDGLFPMASDARAMRSALQAGELPLWEPKFGLGAPLFAQSMFGALYPPHWLAFVLESDLALGWIALADLWLAGLGLYLFLRSRGIGFGAALVGAAVFQTGGFASANLHDLMKVEAGLWLPWSLWAIERVLANKPFATLALAASIALSFLAGFPPIAVFCALAAILYASVRAGSWARWAHCGVGIALGLALAAVQLVPMAEAHRESTRQARTSADAAADGVPLAAGLTLVAPEIFGRADEPVFAPGNSAAWWLARSSERELAANANLLEWNGFAGALALALAVGALLARPRAAAFPVCIALASLGFAQGWPGLAGLRELPGLDLGSPARAGVLAWCAWAWLAALGAQALLAHDPHASAACWAGLLLAVGGAWLALSTDPQAWQEFLPARLAERFGVSIDTVHGLLSPEELARGARGVRVAGWSLAAFGALALCGTAGVLLLRRRPAWAPAWLALFALAASEGAWYARVHLAPREVTGDLYPTSPAMEALREAAGDGRMLRLDTSEGGIADVLDLARPNLPQAYGVADLSPWIVFTPRRAVELWGAADPRATWRSGVSRISDPELLDHPVLDVLRVTAVLAKAPIEHPRLEAAFVRDGFCVHRRLGVPPRARVVTEELLARPDATAVQLLAARASDPARQTVLPPGTKPWCSAGEVAAGSVTIESDRAGRTEVRTSGTPRGWLVLADAWYPGWHATVDGREVPIVAVDHALRGVALTPGDHVVTFTYAPRSLRTGAWISLLAAALLLGLAGRDGRRIAVS